MSRGVTGYHYVVTSSMGFQTELAVDTIFGYTALYLGADLSATPDSPTLVSGSGTVGNSYSGSLYTLLVSSSKGYLFITGSDNQEVFKPFFSNTVPVRLDTVTTGTNILTNIYNKSTLNYYWPIESIIVTSSMESTYVYEFHENDVTSKQNVFCKATGSAGFICIKSY